MEHPESQPIRSSVVALRPAHRDLRDLFLREVDAASTKRTYGNVLDQFEQFIGRSVTDARRDDIRAYRDHLGCLGRAPGTIRKHAAVLKSLFAFGAAEGLLDRDIAKGIKLPKQGKESPRKGLSMAEVRALLAALDSSTLMGRRDRLLLLLLGVQGWRISEALGLRVEDLGEDQGHRVAVVRGKGGTVFRVPLAAITWEAAQALATDLDVVEGPLLVQVTKGGKVRNPDRPVSTQAGWKRVRYLAQQAGLDREIHPHLFRHGAITEALAAGVPLQKVQDFARHADPRTTRTYDGHRLALGNETPHVLAGRLHADGIVTATDTELSTAVDTR